MKREDEILRSLFATEWEIDTGGTGDAVIDKINKLKSQQRLKMMIVAMFTFLVIIGMHLEFAISIKEQVVYVYEFCIGSWKETARMLSAT